MKTTLSSSTASTGFREARRLRTEYRLEDGLAALVVGAEDYQVPHMHEFDLVGTAFEEAGDRLGLG